MCSPKSLWNISTSRSWRSTNGRRAAGDNFSNGTLATGIRPGFALTSATFYMYLFLFLPKGWGQKKLSKTMCFRILSGLFSFSFNAFLGPQGSLVLPLMFRPFPRPCQFLFLCQFLLLPQLLIFPPFQPHHPVSPITLVIHIMGSYLFCFMSASESVRGGFLSSCPFVCICIYFF